MDKLKDLPAEYVALGVALVILLLIHPALAIVAGVAFALHKTGRLQKVFDRVRALFAPKS